MERKATDYVNAKLDKCKLYTLDELEIRQQKLNNQQHPQVKQFSPPGQKTVQDEEIPATRSRANATASAPITTFSSDDQLILKRAKKMYMNKFGSGKGEGELLPIIGAWAIKNGLMDKMDNENLQKQFFKSYDGAGCWLDAATQLKKFHEIE